MKKKFACILCCLVFTLSSLAQTTTRPQEKDSQGEPPTFKTITRVYDVHQLLQAVSDYPLNGPLVPPNRIGVEASQPGPVGPQGSGLFGGGQPTPAHQEVVDHLIKVLEETIDPVTWRDNGGAIASIKEFNGELIVTQLPEDQTAIQALLNEMDKGRPDMVRVRVDWAMLTPNQLETVLVKGPHDNSAAAEVDRDALIKLARLHGTAQLSCFSGQLVHVTSGPAQDVITSSTPVVGNGVVGYQNSTQLVQFGMSLQMKPLCDITLGHSSATLDLLCIASEPRGQTAAPTTNPSDVAPQGLNSIVQTFHTTMKLPINKPILAGGMTFEPTITKSIGQQLYVIVEVNAGAK
jgi:hypothetical protein